MIDSGKFTEKEFSWNNRSVIVAICIVVLLGLFLRLYNYFAVPLINPDGTLYIQQAKALYFGLHDHLLSCLPYLSSYPFFIVVGYKLFGDWLLAAQLVSLFFGTLTFFPLFGLLRRFFDETVSLLGLLIFSITPAFISLSQDAIRGPVYWFFSMMGLFLFTCFIEKPKTILPFFSALCFIVCAWTRIEGILFFFTAGFYILIAKDKRRWSHLFSYLLPLLFLSVTLLSILVTANENYFTFLQIERLTRPLEVYERYKELRHNLKILSEQFLPGFSPYFFDKVRNLVWLIALGTLTVQIIETLYHIFFIVLAMGVVEYRHQIFKDSRITFFSVTAGLALIVLYMQILYNWAMTSRFVPLVLFPAFIFIGAGLKMILRILKNRFSLKSISACVLITALFLTLTVPKILRANYIEDKTVFRKVGQFIAQRENGQTPISVAGALEQLRMIHFYSNLDYPGAPCFSTGCFFPKVDQNVFQNIKNAGCDYLVWDEKNWKIQESGNILPSSAIGFIKLNTWKTERFGRIILYKVNK